MLKIEIRDSDNSVEGVLDISSKEDLFPFSINKKLSDIDNITERSGVWTTTFKIPGTNSNNKLLRSMFHIGARDTGNMSKEKPAIVFVGNIQMDRGRIFIRQVNIDGGYEYEAEYYGNNMEWAVGLNDLYLADLDWVKSSTGNTGGDIYFHHDTVQESWIHGYADEWIMPFINRGKWTGPGGNPETNNFRPELFLRTVLEYAFKKLGFTLSSSFINSTTFNQLILTYVGSFTNSENERGNARFQGKNTDESERSLNGGDESILAFANEIIDTGNNHISPAYTAPADGYYNFVAALSFDPHPKLGAVSYPGSVHIEIKQFSSVTGTTNHLIYADSTLNFTALYGSKFSLSQQIFSHAGDTFRLIISWISTSGGVLDFIFNTSSQLDITLDPKMGQNMTFKLKNVLDKEKYPILSIVNDVSRMFNFHWTTNNATKTVFAEPRDRFFKGIDKADNWSELLDLSRPIMHRSANKDRKRFLDFQYAEDPEDGYLKGRNDWHDNIFAAHTHDFGSEYDNGTDQLKTDVVAPTYFIWGDIFAGTGVKETSPILPRLWSESASSAPDYSDNFAPRILNYFKGSQVNDDGNNRRVKLRAPIILLDFTSIPTALLYPFNGAHARLNLSWGYNVTDSLFGTLKPLYLEHYAIMLGLIDKGKTFEAYFKLTPNKWKKIDFRKPIYIDRPAEFKGYYYIQQIHDYNPISQDTVRVTLVQYKNKQEQSLKTGVSGEITLTEARPIKAVWNSE